MHTASMASGHIGVTCLLAIALALQLKSVCCANEPCLDLYKGVPRRCRDLSDGMPNLTGLYRLSSRAPSSHDGSDPCSLADAHRPKAYNTAELEDTSSFKGLAHKTITGMRHHGTRQLEVLCNTESTSHWYCAIAVPPFMVQGTQQN